VLLQDRGGIHIGKNAVIGSYARILSYSRSKDNFDEVTLQPTVVGEGAMIGSHAIVQGGSNIGAHQIVGEFPALRN
jgi:acetyltransferase-like isoleucine patch superfamily enzyme